MKDTKKIPLPLSSLSLSASVSISIYQRIYGCVALPSSQFLVLEC